MAAIPPASRTARTARFADFELDLHSGELTRGGITIRLPDQPFRILVVLLERPGEVVTRDELRATLWTADTFVDFDTGLNSAIRKLRDALGDSAERPRFIETLPRRGYRLIASMSQPAGEDVGSDAPIRRKRMLFVGAAAALVLIGGAIGWFQFGRPSKPKIESLAILPLTNLTADRAQDYFADGITDALTAELSQLRDVRVISRTSTMQYRSRSKSLPEIAKDLDVDGIIEGTVIRSGERVRINAQLIHASDERRLWTGNYDREAGDILVLQRELAQAVASAVRAQLGGSDVRPAPQINPKAYDSYLRSRDAVGKGTNEGLVEAIAYVQDATERQPDFAAAWAAMGRYYVQGSRTALLSPDECLRRAEVAARRALELDPLLAEAHTLRAHVLNRLHWNWPEAEKEYRRALTLAPSDAAAHRAYAVFLTAQGRSHAAVLEAQRSVALDPLFLQARQDLGMALRGAGRYDEAIAEYQRALASDPNVPRAHYQLGRTYLAAGRIEKGTAELETAVKLSRLPRYLYHLGYAYGRSGRGDDARRILDELKRETRYVSPFGLAVIHTGLGDHEAALAALERAYAERAVELPELKETRELNVLAAEPRFRQLLAKMRLPPAVEPTGARRTAPAR